MLKRDTCIKELKDTIQDDEVGKKTFEECGSFIKGSKNADITP